MDENGFFLYKQEDKPNKREEEREKVQREGGGKEDGLERESLEVGVRGCLAGNVKEMGKRGGWVCFLRSLSKDMVLLPACLPLCVCVLGWILLLWLFSLVTFSSVLYW